MSKSPEQSNLFGAPGTVPEGFRYAPEIITKEEEQEYMDRFAQIPLIPYLHANYVAKRRVAFFGLHYEAGARENLIQTEIPEYLFSLRDKAASFAGVTPEEFVHALVTEYVPGTPIGWHRDSPPFDRVVGISFGAPCPFRMRLEAGEKWQRYSQTVEPRSIYIMEGPARYKWQHSIPPLEELRYSVTFRTVR